MIERLSSLQLLDVELLDKLGTLMIGLRTDGIALEVFETARSPGRQERLYAIGRDPKDPSYGRTLTRADAYQSPHQWGMAADLVFKVGGKWTWEEPVRGQWERMAHLAYHAGLVTLSFERPHVQLPGFNPTRLPTGPAGDDDWLVWLGERLGRQGVG